MAQVDDLIDFNVIEGQKENIEALPSGRSAKALAQRFSPVNITSPAETQDINAAARSDFELELSSIDDSDDPLDIFDRYVRWTLNAYPTSSATGQSQLLPLLERATRTFLKDETYKNDARYLKLWLQYIRLFSDAPRETFAYLARHDVGAGLALYYEEFAGWLEGADRCSQAEEIYKLGIERQARPVERLLRKFGEFEARSQARPSTQGPASPALPTVRPALVAKSDPFSMASPDAADPQAADRARAAAMATKKQKMQIFAGDGEVERPASGDRANGWGNLGTRAERRKENVTSAQPWNGEKMGVGMAQNAAVPKMAIFKDQSSQVSSKINQLPAAPSAACNTTSRSGKVERVFVNLELVYPNPSDPTEEYCFEELRAACRGWSREEWGKSQSNTNDVQRRPKMHAAESTTTLIPLAGGEASEEVKFLGDFDRKLAFGDENDQDGHPAGQRSEREAAKRFRREERANRTRKIRVKEAKAETQTIQTNLDSPRRPRLKRKKSTEPTMTVNTKAATDEVYELFNQSISEDEQSDDNESDTSSSSSDDEDGYTTGGESTGTGRISGTTSEFGEETQGEIADDRTDAGTTGEVDATQDDTGWSDFTSLPKYDNENAQSEEVRSESQEKDEALPMDAKTERSEERQLTQPTEVDKGDLITPTSPQSPAPTSTRFVPEPPANYHAPTRPYRDADQVAANRLPFMTPIVEKTETSFGTLTQTGKDYFTSKTPCPKAGQKTPQIAEDDDAMCSSPFEEDVVLKETTKFNVQSSQEQKIFVAKASSTPIVKAPRPLQRREPEAKKGPIIRDGQCNPMAPELHQIILSEMQPPLSSYDGFFDRRQTRCNRKQELQKYSKSMSSSRGKSGNDKTLSTLAVPPILNFTGAEHNYALKRELGAGAFAPVYLAEALSSSDAHTQDTDEDPPASMGRGNFAISRPTLQALKMEDPPSAWEFYMLRCAHRRLGVSRPVQSVIQAYEMHLFKDEGYLFEEYRDQGTLLDLVNVVAEHNRISGTSSAGMDECLAMFFTIEILRTVEALHGKGIIHGDLKADNVLLRLTAPDGDTEVASQYSAHGSSGWSAKGITLIDFGRGIDMRHFVPNVQFIADWPTTETDCAEMRELRPWTFQADYHGIAAIAHTMLFGKYIETIAERGGIGAGAAKTYRLREGLKRWWQTEIWEDFFALLLNPTRHLEMEEGQKMPVTRGLRECREKMEKWLEGNSEKGVGLKNWIRKLEGSIAAKRK